MVKFKVSCKNEPITTITEYNVIYNPLKDVNLLVLLNQSQNVFTFERNVITVKQKLKFHNMLQLACDNALKVMLGITTSSQWLIFDNTKTQSAINALPIHSYVSEETKTSLPSHYWVYTGIVSSHVKTKHDKKMAATNSKDNSNYGLLRFVGNDTINLFNEHFLPLCKRRMNVIKMKIVGDVKEHDKIVCTLHFQRYYF